MTWAAPLAVVVASGLFLVVSATIAPRQKAIALALAAAVELVLPWFAGDIPLVRGLLALNFMAVFRATDLVRLREPWSVWRRIAHAFDFVDTRLLRRERPRIDVGALVSALLFGVVAASGLTVVRRFAPQCDDPRWLRWAGGLVFTYSTIEAGYRVIRAGHVAVGFVPPPLHVWPIASLTITEFWGMRWARPVSHWLRTSCYLPLARRRHRALGVLLAFFVSAFGHAYPVLVAVGPTMTALMFGYFLVQGVFVFLESRLGVASWPRALRRTWTVVIMIATSPLFVEPCLRVVLGP